MHKYGDQIGAHILSTYRPLYNFDPTPEENAILDTLGTKRKPLPGQEKAGLLPAQRHVATAAARAIRKHGVGNIQGEMGTGKSVQSIAATELLNAYPAIVMCPPHLVPKWIREVEETVPGARAMEIARIGRYADDLGDVNDVRNFLQRYESGELGPKPVAVIAHTSAKYGAGWEHAVMRRRFVDVKMMGGCLKPAVARPVAHLFKSIYQEGSSRLQTRWMTWVISDASVKRKSPAMSWMKTNA